MLLRPILCVLYLWGTTSSANTGKTDSATVYEVEAAEGMYSLGSSVDNNDNYDDNDVVSERSSR